MEEIMLLKKQHEQPLLATLRKMQLNPLSTEASVKLALGVRTDLPFDSAWTIAELSGGIPP